jgi:hypothetical protein
VNPDLVKAERALGFGDSAEASVHAWNALATIDPIEAGRLRRVAEELGDQALIAELDRRGLSGGTAEASSSFRFRTIAFPLAIMTLIVVSALYDLLSEREAPKIEHVRTARAMAQPSPVVTERDGVWLVRIGNYERVSLRELAEDLTHHHDLPVGVLPAIDPVPDAAVDEKEEELDGDLLVSLLEQWYGAEGRATIIGITDFPMVSHHLENRRPYMLRSHPHYAVISTADLGAGPFDRLRGHTRYERTRKLVGRGIGFLYLLRPVSSDPKSLVRSEMSGTDDIDALHERL